MIILTSREFLLNHIASMRERVIVPLAEDRDNLAQLEAELRSLAARHKTLSYIRVSVFVLLYASIASNFALPALSILVETFTLIASLVGAGILSLVALYLTWRLGQLLDRMMIIGSHVIAIYEKHSGAVYPARKGKVSRITKKR